MVIINHSKKKKPPKPSVFLPSTHGFSGPHSWPTPHDPMDCTLPSSSVHGIFPGEYTGVYSSIYIPPPGFKPESTALEVDSFTTEPSGKPFF